MQALTIRQPWAWAIMHAGKNIENRSRLTRYRGVLAVHASARKPTRAELEEFERRFDLRLPSALPLGVVLGTVELVECLHADDALRHETRRPRWGEADCWYWYLADPRPFRCPVPARGSLSFWEWQPADE